MGMNGALTFSKDVETELRLTSAPLGAPYSVSQTYLCARANKRDIEGGISLRAARAT